jgi:hypothetical protein
MSKNDVLITLIKEVVKNEVKRQVKEEVAKLIKSGAVTLNSQKKSTPSLAELTEANTTAPIRKQTVVPTQQKTQQPKKEFSKDPMINEILNMTQPFSSAQRSEAGGMAGMMGGSVLDSIKRESEEDWGTINMNTDSIKYTQQNSNIENADAVTKALTRDYSELVKRFK